MDTLLFIAFGDVIALIVGIAIGWIVRGHVHEIADKAVSAATRAVAALEHLRYRVPAGSAAASPSA